MEKGCARIGSMRDSPRIAHKSIAALGDLYLIWPNLGRGFRITVSGTVWGISRTLSGSSE